MDLETDMEHFEIWHWRKKRKNGSCIARGQMFTEDREMFHPRQITPTNDTFSPWTNSVRVWIVPHWFSTWTNLSKDTWTRLSVGIDQWRDWANVTKTGIILWQTLNDDKNCHQNSRRSAGGSQLKEDWMKKIRSRLDEWSNWFLLLRLDNDWTKIREDFPRSEWSFIFFGNNRVDETKIIDEGPFDGFNRRWNHFSNRCPSVRKERETFSHTSTTPNSANHSQKVLDKFDIEVKAHGNEEREEMQVIDIEKEEMIEQDEEKSSFRRLICSSHFISNRSISNRWRDD